MNITERLPKETAREYAFRTIKDNIVSLQLVPGSMISENELATEIGISRTPVREALIELSKLKIVEIYPQKGSYISLIDSEIVEEARFVRLMLESAVVELACEIATHEHVFALEENLRLQDFYMQSKVSDKHLQLDNEFHRLLFVICKKEFTYELLGGMMTHFDRVRSLSLATVKSSNLMTEHEKIVAAIKNKDKSLAREIITKHLSRYKVDEEELRKRYPQYFKESD